ncbi:hypothetical protein XIS1_1290004 [Xenorhabdus innexi]|uniref:Uncharacterized protein n=1 Tax=Xenorhabdus innexi TaxID=290109 RepID=A0A1N6MST6_9GAMM|nr:hypothetical protein XIS1_1290004 [Xenorhabdus innexi]
MKLNPDNTCEKASPDIFLWEIIPLQLLASSLLSLLFAFNGDIPYRIMNILIFFW